MALETFSETIGNWSITKLATYVKAIIQESIPTSLTLKNLTVTNEFNSPGDSAHPIGSVIGYAGADSPDGWLLCDGSSKDTTAFAALFAIIGYTYGGAGSSFNVPSLKGRIPVGLDSAQTEFDVLGETGGSKTHTLTTAELPAHSHGPGTLGTSSVGEHTHSGTTSSVGAHNHTHFEPGGNTPVQDLPGGTPVSGPRTAQTTGNAGAHNHGFTTGGGGAHGHTVTTGTTASVGSGTAHNNIQPYLVLNYIIKV